MVLLIQDTLAANDYHHEPIIGRYKESGYINKRIFSRILERCHPIEIKQTKHRLKNGRIDL